MNPARPKRNYSRRRTLPEWQKGRALWDTGKLQREIAEELGVTLTAVKSHAARYWPQRMVRGEFRGIPKTLAANTPVSEEIPPQTVTVRCHECLAEYPAQLVRLVGLVPNECPVCAIRMAA